MGEVCRKAGISAFLALGARPKTSKRNVILGAEHLERQFAHNAQRAPE